MHQLHDIDTTGYSKARHWCGPSAVATISGATLKEATEQLTRIHGTDYQDLEGTWEEDVLLALIERGYKAQEVDLMGRYPNLTHGPTLQRYLNERPPVETFNPVLIGLATHFVVAHWSWLSDNWVMKPRFVADFPKRGRLVKTVHIIMKENS